MKHLGRKRVLVESPGYEPFWLTNLSNGLDVEFIDRDPSDFSFDLEKINQIASEGDWLWLANPHNPSGKILTPQEISDLAKVMKRKNGYLFVDEIYHDFVSPFGHDSAINLGDNIIVSSSLTKVYGLGSLKLGWLLGPEDIIKIVTNLRLHEFMLIPGPSVSMAMLMLDHLSLFAQIKLKD